MKIETLFLDRTYKMVKQITPMATFLIFTYKFVIIRKKLYENISLRLFYFGNGNLGSISRMRGV